MVFAMSNSPPTRSRYNHLQPVYADPSVLLRLVATIVPPVRRAQRSASLLGILRIARASQRSTPLDKEGVMWRDDLRSQAQRLSRRLMQSKGAAAGAVGAGLAVGAMGAGRTPVAAQPMPWRIEHLEDDLSAEPVVPAVITQAGGGPPMRGDWFYIDLTI